MTPEKIDPNSFEAHLARSAGISALTQQNEAIKATQAEIEQLLSDATILELFSLDRTQLSPEQVTLIDTASQKLLGMIEQIKAAEVTTKSVLDLFQDKD